MINATTIHKPTLLQKLLGRQYKWWYLFEYLFKSKTTYRTDQVFFIIGSLLSLVGTLLIWWIAGGKNFNSDFQDKLNYFLVGEIFYYIIFNFAAFYAIDIRKGNISKDLLKPQSYLFYTFIASLGNASFQKLINVTIISLLCLCLIWNRILTLPTFNNLFLTFLILPIGLIIFYFLEILVAFSAFWTTETNGILLNYNFLSKMFSGKIFPLGLLISSLTLNIFNPFAFTFYHPMQIYLGKYDTNQTLLVFAGGIAWCVALYFLAKFVFKKGLKRNEAVGL